MGLKIIISSHFVLILLGLQKGAETSHSAHYVKLGFLSLLFYILRARKQRPQVAKKFEDFNPVLTGWPVHAHRHLQSEAAGVWRATGPEPPKLTHSSSVVSWQVRRLQSIRDLLKVHFIKSWGREIPLYLKSDWSHMNYTSQPPVPCHQGGCTWLGLARGIWAGVSMLFPGWRD